MTSSKFGMQSMDQTLVSLYKRKLISKENLLLRLRHMNAEGLDADKEYALGEEDSRAESDVDSYNPNPEF
jgi:Tfp pilus assembly ATPase PilU